jgi:putative flippase GtrA
MLKKNYLEFKFIRFIFIGIINTIFGYGIYFILIKLGIHYSLAVLISTVLSIIFNFKTIGTYVFKESSNNPLVRFIAIYGLIYILNVFCIKFLNASGISFEISGLIMLIPMAFLSFILNKYLVFKS